MGRQGELGNGRPVDQKTRRPEDQKTRRGGEGEKKVIGE